MQRPSLRTVLYFIVDLLLLLAGVIHVPSITNRATIPFEFEFKRDTVVVSTVVPPDAVNELVLGDRVLMWESKPISYPQALEFLADVGAINEDVVLTIQRETVVQSVTVQLVPYYPSARFVLVTVFVGFAIWLFGVVVLFSRPREVTASVLHWTMVLFGTAVIMTWGAISSTELQSYVERGIWFLTYAGSVSSFFFFTTLYPKGKPGSILLKSIATFTPAAILAGGMIYYHLQAMGQLSLEEYASFQQLFNLFQLSLFIYFGGGIFNIAHSYGVATTSEEKRRLQWIIWGLSVGATPYLLLHILPQVLFSTYLVPEEYPTIVLLAVPFSFTVSLIRYKFLDIEVLISRSILYGFLTFIVAITYVVIVLFAASVMGEETELEKYLAIATVTLLVGATINTLRVYVQRLLDEKLFPARRQFRKIVMLNAEQMQAALFSDDVFLTLFETARRIMPFEAAAVYRYDQGRLVKQTSTGAPMKPTLAIKKQHGADFGKARVFTVRGAIDFEHPDIDHTNEPILQRLGCAVMVPLLSKKVELLGVFAARPSPSTGALKEEEVDLLRAVCLEASENLQRLSLQKHLFLEQEERKRVESLSKLKSDFVSYVSHEFQNPLTSILLHTEFIKKRTGNRRARHSAEIIQGESERLSRMVTTVLDTARIEQGLKEYVFQSVDISSLTRNVLSTMSYQIRINGFKLSAQVPRRKLVASVDPDAVSQALMNLISNALKYGRDGKYLRITLSRKGKNIIFTVKDRGTGMTRKVLEHLFERYYRAPSQQSQVKGVGLGLSLVKHILDAHGGTVTIQSTVGKGTVVTLLLPATR